MSLARRCLVASLGCILIATPALAVNGGALDGGAHPAVGNIYGSTGATACDGQVLGCSGVLISPTVFLTSGGCAYAFAHPEDYGYVLTGIWISFDPSAPFGCTSPTQVSSSIPNPAWNETTSPYSNVGVMILAAASSVTPADLPPADLLATLSSSQPYTVVSFGDADGGAGTSAATLARRSASADFKSLNAEELMLTLNRNGKIRTCIGAVNEAGAAYLDISNEIASLVILPDHGNCFSTDYQRLDVPSVRTFLSGYVTLP